MRNMKRVAALLILIICSFFMAGIALASDGADMQALAKESQNPVADMSTLPFKNNLYFDEGPHNRFGYVLDVQPVYPINMGEATFTLLFPKGKN